MNNYLGFAAIAGAALIYAASSKKSKKGSSSKKVEEESVPLVSREEDFLELDEELAKENEVRERSDEEEDDSEIGSEVGATEIISLDDEDEDEDDEDEDDEDEDEEVGQQRQERPVGPASGRVGEPETPLSTKDKCEKFLDVAMSSEGNLEFIALRESVKPAMDQIFAAVKSSTGLDDNALRADSENKKQLILAGLESLAPGCGWRFEGDRVFYGEGLQLDDKYSKILIDIDRTADDTLGLSVTEV